MLEDDVIQTQDIADSNDSVFDESTDDAGGASTAEEISLARKQGWRPLEEFKGNPEDFVDAHEYLERGKSWANTLTKEVQALRTLVREQAIYNTQRLAKEREDAKKTIASLEGQIGELRNLKKEAIKNADGDAVVDIDQKIDETREAINEAKAVVTTPDKPAIHPLPPEKVQAIVENFKEANPWYVTDRTAARYANMAGDEYIASHPGAQLEDVLVYVETETKKAFPKYGKHQPQGPDSAGEGRSGNRSVGNQVSRNSSTPKWDSLDEAGKRLGEQMIEHGVFKNRQEFVEHYLDNDINVKRVVSKYHKNREEKK